MRSPEKIVLVDMDGVIADFDGKVMKDLKFQHPEAPEHKPFVREIISKPSFFTKLEVIEGAHSGWEQLIDAGYRPQICTSPLLKIQLATKIKSTG